MSTVDEPLGSPSTAASLAPFALAGDLGRGQPAGHVFRTAIIAAHLARALGLSEEERAATYYAALLVHTGCTAASAQLAAYVAADELVAQRELCLCDPSSGAELLRWMRHNIAPGAARARRVRRVLDLLAHAQAFSNEVDGGCSDVGMRLAQRLGLPASVSQGLFHICETWNGKGPHGLRGAAIPLTTRLVNAAMVIEVLLAAYGRDRASKLVARRSARSLDPRIVEAWQDLSTQQGFWSDVNAEEPWPIVLRLEPSAARPTIALDTLCETLADFAGFKSPANAAHARTVAKLALKIAAILGLGQSEQALVRRAALVHDIGLAGVPSHLLQKTTWNMHDAERYHTHPYYTAQILALTPELKQVAITAALHHEAMDGSGGAAIPMPARLVTVADAYAELVEGSAQRPKLSREEALRLLQSDRARFDPTCLGALPAALEQLPRSPRTLPKDLTPREAEVLQAAATGLPVKALAQQLVLSEATVRHHLEHIYAKLGVTSRAGAVLFAVEHDLA